MICLRRTVPSAEMNLPRSVVTNNESSKMAVCPMEACEPCEMSILLYFSPEAIPCEGF